MLLARSDLSRLLPDAAHAALERAGAHVRCRQVVTSLARADEGWQLGLRSDVLHVDRVVLALPPDRAAALLESVGATTLVDAVAQLQAIATAPIATVYLRYPPGTRLRDRFNALTESVAAGCYGQWVFDRGAVEQENDGVWSVVISGQGPHLDLARDALVAAVAAQLQSAYALPAPLAAAVLVEKRATIVPAPGLRRPLTTLPLKGLYLAGDAADSPYPSTIEGSVRAGLQAAYAALSTA
jgi:predicted NAD/FAD-dependent oxidoreductase